MSPTPHLRFVQRPQGRILQQLWREHHMPAGETKPKEEWRDVAVVEEEVK